MRERVPSLGEEIANSVSHGVGLIGSLVAAPFLLGPALQSGRPGRVIGGMVFVGAVVLLYFASTLYHALPQNRAKDVFRTLDHGAIFLLIAGSYTPFLLGPLQGVWGWTLLGLVWGLAAVGLLLKATGGLRHPALSMALYLSMGWLALIAIRPLWSQIPHAGVFWLVAGGLFYTAGVGFFLAKRIRYSHFVWHLFVLAGTTCHYVAVMRYAGP